MTYVVNSFSEQLDLIPWSGRRLVTMKHLHNQDSRWDDFYVRLSMLGHRVTFSLMIQVTPSVHGGVVREPVYL